MAIIKINTAASGLDIFLRFNGILTDPTSITYQIKEPAGSTIDTDVGFQRSVGHYDARNTVIPSGFSIIEPWKIIWSFTAPNGITSTATEEFTVTDGLTFSFTDTESLIEQIKLDLGLKDNEFTEEQYIIFITKALNRINHKLCLEGDQVLILNNDGNVTPTINTIGHDLILLAVECLVQKRKRAVSVGKGIRVRDGDSEIDTTAGFIGQKEFMDNICGEFNKAILDLLYRGCSIFDGVEHKTPGEIVWYGNSRINATMDHDGEGTGLVRDMSSPFDTSFDDCPRR